MIIPHFLIPNNCKTAVLTPNEVRRKDPSGRRRIANYFTSSVHDNGAGKLKHTNNFPVIFHADDGGFLPCLPNDYWMMRVGPETNSPTTPQ